MRWHIEAICHQAIKPDIDSILGTITALVPFVSAGARSDSDKTISVCARLLWGHSFSSFQAHFSRSDRQGFWTIAWDELLCIQFVCHRHMTHHLNYGHLVWTKMPSTFKQQQQAGRASAKASIMLQKEKGGHCTLLKVIALPKMGPLQSWN